ncbi:MAG: hypothetical protein WB769_09235 [Pseudolabrys sp.]
MSVATHSATFAVLLMLLAGAPLLSLVAQSELPRRRLGNGAIAVALGAALVFAANATVTKQLTWTPGGFALSFGRMLQDGIVQKYLDEHCPRATPRALRLQRRIAARRRRMVLGQPAVRRARTLHRP